MVMETIEEDERFACFVDPYPERAVSGQRWIEVLDTAFFRIVPEPFEGVFVHRDACGHARLPAIPG
ncbi:hypothetical protein D3C78_1930030 [compost metagenome]